MSLSWLVWAAKQRRMRESTVFDFSANCSIAVLFNNLNSFKVNRFLRSAFIQPAASVVSYRCNTVQWINHNRRRVLRLWYRFHYRFRGNRDCQIRTAELCGRHSVHQTKKINKKKLVSRNEDTLGTPLLPRNIQIFHALRTLVFRFVFHIHRPRHVEFSYWIQRYKIEHKQN